MSTVGESSPLKALEPVLLYEFRKVGHALPYAFIKTYRASLKGVPPQIKNRIIKGKGIECDKADWDMVLAEGKLYLNTEVSSRSRIYTLEIHGDGDLYAIPPKFYSFLERVKAFMQSNGMHYGLKSFHFREEDEGELQTSLKPRQCISCGLKTNQYRSVELMNHKSVEDDMAPICEDCYDYHIKYLEINDYDPWLRQNQ